MEELNLSKDFRQLTLGPVAIDHLRKYLTRGHTLARRLLEVIDLDAGTVITFLPKDISLEAAYQFDI